MATRTFSVLVEVINGDDMTIPGALDFWNSHNSGAKLLWIGDEEIDPT